MSRNDSIGLFWEDIRSEKGGPIREMPKIPKNGWKTPTEFPNISSCKLLGLDIETKDPQLLTHGPGWARGVGHIVGVSIAPDEHTAWYFPMRHEVMGEDNIPPDKVLLWLKDNICTPGVKKIGANILYDIGWLGYEGVNVAGPFYDILYAEALIDETKFKYDLDSCALKYAGEHKKSDKLYSWLARYYGGKPDPSQRANIYRAPPRLVGPYAEGDATLPFAIYKQQMVIIKKEELNKVLKLENKLIPLMYEMRKRGVRVDIPKAEEASKGLLLREKEVQTKLNYIAGTQINVNAADSIRVAFDRLGLIYPKTAKGNPSFTATFLNNHPHEISDLIVSCRQIQKARSTFIDNYIIDKHTNGRIFCEFPQLKGDGGGTVSGRFSSRNPNLQNIPARDPDSKILIRGCFVPDLGYDWWGSWDLSQIEYRCLAHYAIGKMANELRQMYLINPDTDFHQATIDLINLVVNILLERKPAKSINFGLVYGMGKGKLAQTLGLTKKASDQMMLAYHTAVPFVKETFNKYMGEAQQRGVIKTILGRRSRFELYEQIGSYDKELPALPYKQAAHNYGLYNIQRAYTHKALNRLLQGTAADYMKKAMLLMYQSGVFDDLGGPPHLTVHDELDTSFSDCHAGAIKEMTHILNTAIPLRVPVMSTFKYGKNWGELKAYAE